MEKDQGLRKYTHKYLYWESIFKEEALFLKLLYQLK